MFKITGKMAQDSWCVYYLHDDNQKIIFVFYSKLANSMSISALLSNPAFNVNQLYNFQIYNTYQTSREAQNGLGEFLKLYGMPELNKTIKWNRMTRIECIETGKIFKNQYECAKLQAINQSQLSQHLRRNPGYKSIKGMTYRNIISNSPANITYP